MSKFFALALVASALLASVNEANGGRHKSCCSPTPCCAAAPCCTATPAAPSAAATEPSKSEMAQAPQATRSFSYQPSTNYASPRAMTGSRANWGVRDAASKANGSY